MKKYIILCTAISLLSCKSTKGSLVSVSEDDYILAYKKCVLYGCLNESTDGEFYKTMNKSNDLGLATESEILGKIESTEITQIGRELSKNVRTIDYADFDGRKSIYSNCVDFTFSKEIHKQAKEMYKKAKYAKLEYKYE